jgi:hypothetical protein
MDVTNMRENRVRSVGATCEACRHEAVVNCDALPADLLVPDMALRHKCSACGSKQVVTWPNWTERPRP